MKNEPAFPSTKVWITSGMTLRDYLAAKAMQGLVVSYEKVGVGCISNDANLPDMKELVKNAYEIADAMLAERDKP